MLYVGLLTPRKGVLDLIEASRAPRTGLDHELWLLGGVPTRDPKPPSRCWLPREGDAVLLGTRSPEEMPAAYAAADVFCLPSWWEAMPLSVLEAMASDSRSWPPTSETWAASWSHDETGLIVAPQSPDQLASSAAQGHRGPRVGATDGVCRPGAGGDRLRERGTARAIGDLYDQVSAGVTR